MTSSTPEHVTEAGEQIPMPVAELEFLAAYYDTHDTSDEMRQGLEWVDPRESA